MKTCLYRRYRQEELRDGITPQFIAESPSDVLRAVEQLRGSS
jgi:hypothetical protein